MGRSRHPRTIRCQPNTRGTTPGLPPFVPHFIDADNFCFFFLLLFSFSYYKLYSIRQTTSSASWPAKPSVYDASAPSIWLSIRSLVPCFFIIPHARVFLFLFSFSFSFLLQHLISLEKKKKEQEPSCCCIKYENICILSVGATRAVVVVVQHTCSLHTLTHVSKQARNKYTSRSTKVAFSFFSFFFLFFYMPSYISSHFSYFTTCSGSLVPQRPFPLGLYQRNI